MLPLICTHYLFYRYFPLYFHMPSFDVLFFSHSHIHLKHTIYYFNVAAWRPVVSVVSFIIAYVLCHYCCCWLSLVPCNLMAPITQRVCMYVLMCEWAGVRGVAGHITSYHWAGCHFNIAGCGGHLSFGKVFRFSL